MTASRVDTNNISPAADTIRTNFGRRADQVRSAAALTPAAKQARLAKLYLASKAQMTATKTAEDDALVARRRAAARAVFSAPKSADAATAAISYRDAQDRAAKIQTPNEALDLLNRADRSGDDALATAIAAHAHDNNLLGGYNDVLNTYLTARPDKIAAFNELQNVPNPNDTMTAINRSFAYAIPQPPELNGMQDHHLQRLADNPALTGH